MWPFKKAKNLESLSDQDHRWTVLQTTSEAGLMLVRINDSASDWEKHPNLNIRVGFAIPLRAPNPGGLPEPEENLLIGEVEDFLDSLMKKTGPALQVLAITTGSFREFVFYIQNAGGIESAHKQAMAKYPELDIQCYGEQDPQWQGYSDWKRA